MTDSDANTDLDGNSTTDDETALIIESERAIPSANDKSASKQHKAIDGLSRKTSLLILDEPTSFLDKETEKLVCDCLKQLRNEFNLTIILIAHKKQTIEALCDRIIDFDQIN